MVAHFGIPLPFITGDLWKYLAPYISFIQETEYESLDPTLVHSCYPESKKRMSDTLCVAYQHQYGVDAKIVRLSHVYGPDWEFWK